LATLAAQSYTPQKFDLAGLQGISDNTLQVRFGLYEGYVKNTNLLNEQIAEQITKGQAAGANPGFAELTRRLGFECAAATLVGSMHTPDQLMLLSRIRVGGAMSLLTFSRLVGGPPPGPTAIAAATPVPRPSASPSPSPTAWSDWPTSPCSCWPAGTIPACATPSSAWR